MNMSLNSSLLFHLSALMIGKNEVKRKSDLMSAKHICKFILKIILAIDCFRNKFNGSDHVFGLGPKGKADPST